MNRAILAAVLGCLALGCRKPDAQVKTKDDAAIPVTAPIAMPVLGVDQIRRFNFIGDAGEQAHQKAVAAYRKKDWAAVRAQAEAALGKDPMHLGSHRLLAAALAQTGEPAAAVDHLVAALAADYFQYAPTLADDDLKSFMASPHGQSIAALAAKIHDEYVRRISGALWLIGRRSPFKWPKDAGVQTAISRGELYAFDRETRHYFRLTHTDHQVLGVVRPAAGNEIAVLGFDKIDRSRSEARSEAKPDAEPAPLFARPWLQLYDTAEWKAITAKISLPAAREITLGYGAGDQLLVSTAQATGRWTVGDPAVSSVDRTTGKLTKVTTALPATRLVVSLDDGHLVRVPDGVVAAWTGDPPVTASLKAETGKPIQIPESGSAAQWSIAVSRMRRPGPTSTCSLPGAGSPPAGSAPMSWPTRMATARSGCGTPRPDARPHGSTTAPPAAPRTARAWRSMCCRAGPRRCASRRRRPSTRPAPATSRCRPRSPRRGRARRPGR
jgi:hypothetical protein